MTRRAEASILGLVALAALALRVIHLDWGFPEVFEEATPVREAVALWGTPGGAIDLNPHFFRYPSLSFYLNFGAQAIAYLWLSLTGGVSSLNEFRQLLAEELSRAALWGRILQAVAGALLVLPVRAMARRLAGEAAGWSAAVLIALAPMAVVESQIVGPDIFLALFAAAALAASTRLVEEGRRSDYLWCGVWIGLATAAKYPGALLLGGLLTAHVLRVRARREGPAGIVISSSLWQALFTAALVFAVASPYVLLDASSAARDITFERRHMALGHLGLDGGRAWLYYLRTAIGDGWTPPLALGGLAGLAALLARSASRRPALPAAVFAALLWLVVGSWKMAAPRYILPLLPAVAVWAGAGAALLGAAIGGRIGAKRATMVALAMLLAAWPAIGSLKGVSLRGREDSRLAAARWIAAHLPEGSTLLVERYGPEPDASRYNVLYLPFHAITPHVYDPAYSLPLYATFDAMVLSSQVDDRYLADTREYPAQAAFYAAVDRAFSEEAVFAAGRYLGPTIRILRRRIETPLRDLSQIPPEFFDTLQGNQRLAEYFSALGTVLARQGRTELGVRMLREAVDMDPENAKPWGNLGVVVLKSGQAQEALDALRRAHALDPADPLVSYNLGRAHETMGETSQAADAYQEAISRDPAMEEAYLGLARALIAADRYASARAMLEEFLRRFPRSTERGRAEQALAELSRMGPGRP
jgi:tetratricopeptide (TPR) repeat protein